MAAGRFQFLFASRAVVFRAGFVAFLLLIVWTSRCKDDAGATKPGEPSEPLAIPAVVLYHFGKVTADGESLRTGDVAPGGAVVKTERKSLSNLQLRAPQSRIVFLMRENAELRLTALRRGKVIDVTPVLRTGRVLVQVERLSNSEEMFVFTPDARLAVQGTEFIVTTNAVGETAVQVHSGAVGVRPRIASLEELPPEILQRSAAARQLLAAVERTEIAVGPGEATRVARLDARETSKQFAMLAARMRAGIAAGRSVEKLARELDAGLAGAVAQLDEPDGALQVLTRTDIAPAERESMRAEFATLVSVSPEVVNDPARLPEAIEALDVTSLEKTQAPPPRAQSSEDQLQALAKNMGGTVKVLVLQNGQELRGVVVNQGEDYLFATGAGQKVYRRDEVREVRLR